MIYNSLKNIMGINKMVTLGFSIETELLGYNIYICI